MNSINKQDQYQSYKIWFKAAAIYNLVWGGFIVLFPAVYFDMIGLEQPKYLAIWQVVGMCILVYAPGYWWAGQNPYAFRHYILIGLLGKFLGPVGFVWSVYNELLPIKFGLTLLTNDLFWWPVFFSFLWKVLQQEKNLLHFIKGQV